MNDSGYLTQAIDGCTVISIQDHQSGDFMHLLKLVSEYPIGFSCNSRDAVFACVHKGYHYPWQRFLVRNNRLLSTIANVLLDYDPMGGRFLVNTQPSNIPGPDEFKVLWVLRAENDARFAAIFLKRAAFDAWLARADGNVNASRGNRHRAQ